MKLEKIQQSNFYHIYNRGINGTLIFTKEENKRYFLSLFHKYLEDKVAVHAFCLMDNHYHFVVEIIAEEKQTIQGFSNFFNAYAKAFNKQEGRTGSLFEKHFKRKHITEETYLLNLICDIHNNPFEQKENYLYSSYRHYINNTQPEQFTIQKDVALDLFNDLENMILVTKLKSSDTIGVGQENLQGSLRENLAGSNNQLKQQFVSYIKQLQDTITSQLEAIDGVAKFQEDLWKRLEGGGGRTRVIENGAVFEKGGVNISQVHGKLPETMQQYFGVKDANFFACGLSLVLHPKNPFVPTVHANWRYFEMYNQEGEIVDQWFGGGQDLTPYYLFDEDATHFHTVCKRACDAHDPQFYPKYKARCDEYFYNAHRNEGRGIGGLFFDYLKKTDDRSMQDWYNFVTQVGDSFLDGYIPIVEKRKDTAYAKEQKDWQEIRRGRYVEFNLVHDKGTLFGLRTNGRIESILMSLPPQVQWRYNHHPEAGSEEERLIQVLKEPKEWV